MVKMLKSQSYQNRILKFVSMYLICTFIFSLSACTVANQPEQGFSSTKVVQDAAATMENPTATVPAKLTSTPESIKVWVDPDLPAGLKDQIVLPAGTLVTTQKEEASVRFTTLPAGEQGVSWIYALVVPFSSLLENADFSDLRSIWVGDSQNLSPLMAAEEDIPGLEKILGPVNKSSVEIVAKSDLLEQAWKKRDVFALIPFEDLQPKWKVISLNDQSPVSNQFDLESYPLKAVFGWQAEGDETAALEALQSHGALPEITSNRDPKKLTVLVMTGVTALVRATAVRMEEKGMTYPADDIHDWLYNADLTHISNEISFSPDCPDPKMDPYPLIFCSKPEYMELLDSVGTDIVDMTGNHQVDWGVDALLYTLNMYKERGLAYYAAGENVEKARDAVLIEHNGNKFAFMGCNPAGPEFIWAAEDKPGVANCDYPWIETRIKELKSQGYQVIFTFQYFETYRHWSETFEQIDFRRIADAGAIIVSGSQAHHPMAMEFYNDSYIHYGLGNLFFDQMWVDTVTIPEGTRKEFIDQHVFYDGKFISTGLLTAYLEDYAKPRPMSTAERQDFLTAIFTAAGWGPYDNEDSTGGVQ